MKKVGTIIFAIGILAVLFTGFMASKTQEPSWNPALCFVVMLVGGLVHIVGVKGNSKVRSLEQVFKNITPSK